jgi:hypothetical protein
MRAFIKFYLCIRLSVFDFVLCMANALLSAAFNNLLNYLTYHFLPFFFLGGMVESFDLSYELPPWICCILLHILGFVI